MKQINPYVAPAKPAKQNSNDLGKLNSSLGPLAGAVAGAAGGPWWAVGTTALNTGLGMLAKDNSAPASAPAPSPTIEVPGGGDNAMSRRKAAMDNDAFAQLRSAATALPNLSPEVQQAAGPSILKGLMANARGGRMA